VTKLGVIGGSGLYDIEQLGDVRSVQIETPFGDPSDLVTIGRVGGRELVFIPRHGAGHRLSPTDVPYRANIHAMKQLGVTHLLSISAVGSLTEAYPPLTLVCPDQIIDRTVFRERSFFEGGIVAHVGIADPFCDRFSDLVIDRAAVAGITVARGGTYVCVEARLAREAELCYVQISMVTDFDVWHETDDPVSVERVIATLHETSAAARQVLHSILSDDLSPRSDCACESALQHAIVTAPEQISAEHRKRLAVIAGKYLSA
jgi:5'-methylthioadenosine phosphorylase